jgi:hypothetical protein
VRTKKLNYIRVNTDFLQINFESIYAINDGLPVDVKDKDSGEKQKPVYGPALLHIRINRILVL